MEAENTAGANMSCPACGSTAPAGAHFCSSCGSALDGTPAPRHVYGMLAPGPTLVLALFLLLAGILALVAGSLVGAIVLAACSGATLVLFYGAANRDPESPIVRHLLTYVGHMRGWAVYGKESAEAWTNAARDVSRLRREAQSFRRERRQLLLALGDAAYSEDDSTVMALRRRLHEIDEGIATREKARTATLAKTRRRVSDEKMAARPTQQLSVEHLRSGEDEN